MSESKVDATLYAQTVAPLTASINYTLPVQTLKITFDLIMTNHDSSSKIDDNSNLINDLPLNNSLNNNLKQKNDENSLQLNQSAWLAEENNVVLHSIDNNEKIVLSRIQSDSLD